MIPSRLSPVRCTSWSAPKRTAPASAPSSQSPRPNSVALRSARYGRALARPPLSPAPRVLASPALTPRAGPLCLCQRGSPDSLPFPGVRSSGAPKEGCGPQERGGCTPGGRGADPCTTSCWGWRPPVPPAERRADCSAPAAEGGAASVCPGRDCARTGGVRVRQGGTALNALDSPAPAPSPPSSTDSWGLCFLHPPGRSRSAPSATRDSPSATAAARRGHP